MSEAKSRRIDHARETFRPFPARLFVLTISLVLIITTAMAFPADAQERLADPIEEGGAPLALETIADGLTSPTWGTALPGDDDRLMVTDQDGVVWSIDLNSGSKSVFLDVVSGLILIWFLR